MTLEHLVQAAQEGVEPVDTLTRVMDLATQYDELEGQLKDAEQAAKDAKARFNKVSMELLPEAMMGMKSITLSDGREVKVTDQLSASVKDYDKLTKFLKGQGDDALLKTTLSIGKVPHNVQNKIIQLLSEKFDIDAEISVNIHPQTLKAYFGKLCGIKAGTVAKVPVGDIDAEMVTLFTFSKTKIK